MTNIITINDKSHSLIHSPNHTTPHHTTPHHATPDTTSHYTTHHTTPHTTHHTPHHSVFTIIFRILESELLRVVTGSRERDRTIKPKFFGIF